MVSSQLYHKSELQTCVLNFAAVATIVIVNLTGG